MNKVWNMGLSSLFSFSKVFFLLMVLMVSSSSPSNDSYSGFFCVARNPESLKLLGVYGHFSSGHLSATNGR